MFVPVVTPLYRRLRHREWAASGLRQRVRRAVDAGVGVYNRAWVVRSDDGAASRADTLTPQVLDWCRLTMARMRRPYGLDYVSLVLAIIDSDEREVVEQNLGVLRPAEFDAGGPVDARVRDVLAAWEGSNVFGAGAGREPRLVALLVSWGDLTRELLLAG